MNGFSSTTNTRRCDMAGTLSGSVGSCTQTLTRIHKLLESKRLPDGNIRPVSGPSKPAAQPIESKADLVTHLEAGCKPREAWRIGTEHEKFVFTRDGFRRPAYDGPRGIRALFEGLLRFGYQPVYEGEHLIALLRADGCSVTFEPGGQIELSGAPLSTLHETCMEVNSHLREVKEVGDELGVGLLGIGFDPKWSRSEVPW